MPVRVLLLSLSEHSLGELHNAIFFARQVAEAGGEVQFLTTGGHVNYTREAGFPVLPWRKGQGASAGLLKEQVGAFRPDVLVLADYYNLFLEEPVIDPEMLLQLALPVATFDSMNFAPGPTLLEKGILRESRYGRAFGKGGQFSTLLPAVPPEMAILRSCPINRPVYGPGIMPVALYKKPLSLPEERREEVRRRFGLGPDDKLVLLARSSWAHLAVKIRAMERSLSTRFSYERILQRLLQLYLRDVPWPVTVLGVGPQAGFGGAEGGVRFASLPFLGMDEYQELLLSTDLFVTDNITSCSAAKAAVGGVPVLVLISSLAGNGDGTYQAPFSLTEEAAAILQQWEKAVPGSIFPFCVFPFGWIRELAPLLEENPYLDVLVTAEMFDVPGTGEKMARLLTDDAERSALAERQAGYRRLLQSLPGAPEALEWVRERQK
ncbi:MAG: hypothetical protein H5T99_14280 [Moorella sp. (in: Bacteria)]|nr:hypothetical protein [Moorella sp. (in: firmicutes)]